MTTSIIDSVIWRREDRPGHDACAVHRTRTGFRIAGSAVFLHGQKPCKLNYEVIADKRWLTRSASVHGTMGRSQVAVDIRRERNGWLLDGVLQEDVAECH